MKLFIIGFILFLVGGVSFLFHFSDRAQHFITIVIGSQEKIYSGVSINEENIVKEKINFTLYYDFSCPHCSSFYENTFVHIQKKYAENFNFSIRPYALNPEGKSFEQSKWFLCLNDEKIGNISENIIIEKITAELELSSIAEVFTVTDEKNKKLLECIENEETTKKVLEIRKQAKEKECEELQLFL